MGSYEWYHVRPLLLDILPQLLSGTATATRASSITACLPLDHRQRDGGHRANVWTNVKIRSKLVPALPQPS